MKDDVDLVIGKGIANALQFLGKRGMLGSHYAVKDGQHIVEGTTVTNEVIKGRNKDQTLSKQLKQMGMDPSQENDRVKLNYSNKQGQELSLKQAFRELSWTFHGKGPSHRQQEKLQRNIDKQVSVFK